MSLVLLRSQTDERLVALARQGHERAFEAIVRRYRRPLLSACRRIVPEALAEDVLQQAFVLAWTGLRRGDDVRDLRAWLFRIVRNTAVSALRRSGHDPPALLDALTAAPSSQEEAERRAVVHETLTTIARLPERQREALLRIAVHGHSQDEVAEELGVSRTAARALVHRARTAVRAAASALMPLPVLTWLASAGTDAEPIGLRIGRLVAGAGGAGATTTLLKAGAVAGVAAAVSAPIITDQHAPKPRPAAVHVTQTRPAETVAATPAPAPAAPVRYTPPPSAVRVRRKSRGGDDARRGSDRASPLSVREHEHDSSADEREGSDRSTGARERSDASGDEVSGRSESDARERDDASGDNAGERNDTSPTATSGDDTSGRGDDDRASGHDDGERDGGASPDDSGGDKSDG